MMHFNITTLLRVHDVAMIALMLAIGLREGEIVSLNVDDLYQNYGNTPALRVKPGKGAKAWLVTPMSR
jgi:site-specific recombinase XerC